MTVQSDSSGQQPAVPRKEVSFRWKLVRERCLLSLLFFCSFPLDRCPAWQQRARQRAYLAKCIGLTRYVNPSSYYRSAHAQTHAFNRTHARVSDHRRERARTTDRHLNWRACAPPCACARTLAAHEFENIAPIPCWGISGKSGLPRGGQNSVPYKRCFRKRNSKKRNALWKLQ